MAKTTTDTVEKTHRFVTRRRFLQAAKALVSVEPEYDRALVELTTAALGHSAAYHANVAQMLGIDWPIKKETEERLARRLIQSTLKPYDNETNDEANRLFEETALALARAVLGKRASTRRQVDRSEEEV